MGYFGGGGVKERLHSSLKAYIECFLSPPFPRTCPRGGGIWDQDPDLMRDFRVIAKFEREWKDAQKQISSAQNSAGSAGGGGGGSGLESVLDGYLDSLGEDGRF